MWKIFLFQILRRSDAHRYKSFGKKKKLATVSSKSVKKKRKNGRHHLHARGETAETSPTPAAPAAVPARALSNPNRIR